MNFWQVVAIVVIVALTLFLYRETGIPRGSAAGYHVVAGMCLAALSAIIAIFQGHSVLETLTLQTVKLMLTLPLAIGYPVAALGVIGLMATIAQPGDDTETD